MQSLEREFDWWLRAIQIVLLSSWTAFMNETKKHGNPTILSYVSLQKKNTLKQDPHCVAQHLLFLVVGGWCATDLVTSKALKRSCGPRMTTFLNLFWELLVLKVWYTCNFLFIFCLAKGSLESLFVVNDLYYLLIIPSALKLCHEMFWRVSFVVRLPFFWEVPKGLTIATLVLLSLMYSSSTKTLE